MIDVGRGMKDGKAVWDMTLDTISDKVAAYTPIPGWVGPLTIANLLMNVKRLYDKYQ
jgi:methylenetetrahydrofolate dehydrogenase (NADP+)/methenyltetrahydrofolate cyclohydrolase